MGNKTTKDAKKGSHVQQPPASSQSERHKELSVGKKVCFFSDTLNQYMEGTIKDMNINTFTIEYD